VCPNDQYIGKIPTGFRFRVQEHNMRVPNEQNKTYLDWFPIKTLVIDQVKLTVLYERL